MRAKLQNPLLTGKAPVQPILAHSTSQKSRPRAGKRRVDKTDSHIQIARFCSGAVTAKRIIVGKLAFVVQKGSAVYAVKFCYSKRRFYSKCPIDIERDIKVGFARTKKTDHSVVIKHT